MAYTYDDFVSAANNAGLLNKFSTADIETAKKNPEFGLSLLGFMQDEANATTPEGRLLAQEGANQIRSSVGNYTQGANGLPISTTQDIANQMKNYGDFTYGNEDQRQQLMQQASNPNPFEYDLEKDPMWGVYKKQATREGDRVISDVLARISAGTGGVPSSYAVSAATQAGDQYAASLTDMIPTLRQNAYNEYLNNYNMNLQALGVLNEDRALTYDEWLQKYNMLGNNLSIFQGLEEAELAKAQQEKNDALTLYQLLGYATPEIAAILGIPEGTKIAETNGTTSNSGGNPLEGATVNNGTLSGEAVMKLQQALNGFGAGLAVDGKWGPNSQAAAQKYWGVTGADDAMKYFDGLNAAPTFSNVDGLKKYLLSKGVPAENVKPINAQVWEKFRRQYLETGRGGAEVKNYDTYAEYLSAYAEFALAQLQN